MFSFDRPAGVRINALYLKPMRAPQPAPLILIKGRQRSSAKVNLFFVLGRPPGIRGWVAACAVGLEGARGTTFAG
jgi:hypothetical protein